MRHNNHLAFLRGPLRWLTWLTRVRHLLAKATAQYFVEMDEKAVREENQLARRFYALIASDAAPQCSFIHAFQTGSFLFAASAPPFP